MSDKNKNNNLSSSNSFNNNLNLTNKSKKEILISLPPLLTMMCASTAASFAECITIPTDTLKVRLQIQEGNKPKYSGVFNCISTMIKEEGISSFFKGLSAGIQRQIIFAGLRVGSYPYVRSQLTKETDQTKIQLHIKMLAALITGTGSISISHPTDVVKIRLQADGRKPPGERRYKGSIDAYKNIIKTEGYKGLYIGLVPNIYRNGGVNMFEISSYDQLKTLAVTKLNLDPDSKILHMICGSLAGMIAISVCSPLDVSKTRIMNDTANKYSSFIDCLVKTYRFEGYRAFYFGYFPSLIRVSSWNSVFFLALEFVQRNVKKAYVKKKENKI